MGFNTIVLVLNDGLDSIAKDPEYGQKVAQATARVGWHDDRGVDISSGNHVNASTVVSCAHADTVQLMAVGGNHVTVLGRYHNGGRHHAREDQVALLKQLADDYGFRLVAKPAKKPKTA